jgi:hypothetical protein
MADMTQMETPPPERVAPPISNSSEAFRKTFFLIVVLALALILAFVLFVK